MALVEEAKTDKGLSNLLISVLMNFSRLSGIQRMVDPEEPVT